ncbi:helix-hairpin-helix domain-containing protein [Candidatus Albibeggiatoa sp. nov. BB20]|uniref:ComEA family DNA-binding protein n=1 Tax=Candidatus Albibeggiatoa sp. nov. BB20 TaxID=3162723 RepID=UPI003365B2A1
MRLLKILFFAMSILSHVVYAEPVEQVNINKAGAERIKQVLSGIGDKKSQAIVEYRNAHGDFNSAYDLMLVNGIGKKTVDKNIDRIILSDPEPAEETSQDSANQIEQSLPAVSISNLTTTVSFVESIKTMAQDAKQTFDIDPHFSAELQITPELLNAAQKAGKQTIHSVVE